MTSFKKQMSSKLAFLALLITFAVPATSLGQGRGWGRGRYNDSTLYSKKCGKFVNCHDARDGRWDGRGPRSSRFDNRWNRWVRHGDFYGRRHFSHNSLNYQRNGYWRRY